MQNSLEKLYQKLGELKKILTSASFQKVELSSNVNPELYDFKSRKLELYKKNFHKSFDEVKSILSHLQNDLENLKKLDFEKLSLLTQDISNTEKLDIIEEIQHLLPKNKSLQLKLPNLPTSIKDEIQLDIKEAQKCFDNQCYRSALILCGRILETALHRKYYELTKKDLLETSPNLGAGKLIAKLKELSVKFDPGVTEQIHLINNIRIKSVHKKQTTFLPSRQQTQAIMLFCVDTLKKLF